MTHAGLACDVRHELVFVDSSLLSDKKSGKPGSAEAWQSVRTGNYKHSFEIEKGTKKTQNSLFFS